MTRDDDILGEPYRSVRPVDAPSDGPWPGMLTWLANGERRVLVDADVLGDDWRGWDASPDDHVLTPLDVGRRGDGHDVALPVCGERVLDFLTRRAAAHAPLSPGEAVTLGISVLRGCAQTLDRPGLTGEWWLTENGRPVLATDASNRRARDGAVELFSALTGDTPVPRAWEEALEALSADTPRPAAIERAENALFALADPVALDTTEMRPRPARHLAAVARDDATVIADPGRHSLWESLVRHVDSDLADAVSRSTTAIWRRARARRSARRAPWLVGAAAATAVLCTGLLWPTADEGDAAATGPTPSGSALVDPPDGGPTSTAGPGVPAHPSADDAEPGAPHADLAEVTSALLDDRTACAGDVACLSEVVVDPASVFQSGPIDLPAEGRSVVLLDDFGGVAVLRVDAADGSAAQLVVIERQDGEWLLRDAHAAQQP